MNSIGDALEEPKLVIIGLSGFGGSGKDTIASFLEDDFKFERRAFADKVRQFALLLNAFLPEANATYSQLISLLGYEQAKREHTCVRDYLVRIGHGARTTLGSTVWLDAALPPLETEAGRCLIEKGGLYVYSDVRYLNEATRIREYGGSVWRVARPGCLPAHETERVSLEGVECDVVIDNKSDLSDLRHKVHHALISYPPK